MFTFARWHRQYGRGAAEPCQSLGPAGSLPPGRRRLAALGIVAFLATGCFGYNAPAKRAAYLGNTVLVLGGGGALAAELLIEEEACQGAGCVEEVSPITGPMVAGTMLVTAGLVGFLLNLTRPTVKTSR